MKRKGNEDMRIEWCETKEMWGDYFTKPLSGALFKKMRRHILGIDDGMIAAYNDDYKMFAEEQKKRIKIAAKQKE